MALTLEGNLDYSKILEGRRPYSAHLTVMPDTSSSKSIFSAEDVPIEDENAKFINGIRQVVKEWRKQGYPKVPRTSRDLLAYWFLNPERELNKSLFFCQREAVETAVYLNEVAPRDPNLGRSILHELDRRRETISDKYQHISRELPKKGQKKVKKEAKENGEERPVGEKAPNLPSLLNLAFEQFVKDYEDYDKGIRQDNEAARNLFTAPPVFIVVCNNTTVSKEVFKYMAGYETVDSEGNLVYIDGHFEIFSNYRNGMPVKRQPSLLIDSIAIDEAGAIVDDEFKPPAQ